MDLDDVIASWLMPTIIFVGILAAGIIAQRLLIIYLQKVSERKKWKAGPIIARSIKGTMVLVALIVGVYLGLMASPLTHKTLMLIQKGHNVAIILLLTFILARILTGVFEVYMHGGAETHDSISLIKSITNVVVYIIGLLVIFQTLGVSITPVITALGISGLAVALALQDTLANLFAGIQITLTRKIRVNQYIVMSTGEEGIVDDITWRNTMLLTQGNNIIIIPNSKLATTTVTNYSLPQQNLSASLNIYIGYDNDLEKVERIAMEVTKQVLDELDFKNGNPSFACREFGTTAITCGIFFSVRRLTDQYGIKHVLIKRLHSRFQKENIAISLPLNTILNQKKSS